MYNEDDIENLTDDDFVVNQYEKKYKLELPRRNSYAYLAIENFKDYEYTNCLAYEMVIRTEEFNELPKKYFPDKNLDWRIKVLELGLDPSLNRFLEEPNYLLANDANERFFIESWLSHTIKDIQDGLNKLIKYYVDKDEVFILEEKNNKSNSDSYKKVNNVTVDMILKSPQNYYIPCLFTNDYFKIDTKGIRQKQQICDKIPLRILEKDFLSTLKLLDIKYKYTQLMPRYSRPEVFFPQSNIVNIPINLNLEIEEIIAYISKAKEEYHKKVLKIKYPLELVEGEYEESEKPKSVKEFPDEKNKRKKAVADAFYVHDLYKVLKPYFKDKQTQLRNTRDNEVKKIKDKFRNIKKEKDENIQNIKNTYKDEISQYSDSQLNNIISDISGLSTHKVERYHKYMQEYINEKKYMELITGKVITEKNFLKNIHTFH